MPVYESHLTDYPHLKLGTLIAHERQRLGLTLQELAARSAISTARLSQIENDLYIPDLMQGHAIAAALGLSIDKFLPSDRALPYQVTRYSDSRDAAPIAGPSRNGCGCELSPLADLFVGRQIEPILVRLVPGGAPHFRHHPGLEFAFVRKGRVEFIVQTPLGERREELQRGDCIYIRAHHPHMFRCLGDQAAECIHVLSSPSAGGVSGSEWLPQPKMRRTSGNPDACRESGLLGRELAALRLARGWTVSEVARMVNLKERQVEQVELGERAASLDALVKLARVFNKPLRELLHDPREEGPYYSVKRSAEIREVPARPRRMTTDHPDAPMPNSYHPLFGGFPTSHMYPCLVRIRNIDMQMLVPHEHHGQEFFYILDGRVELVTYAEDKEVRLALGPGDSCLLDASVPHLIRGETLNPYSTTSAELIDVYWCPLGEQYLFGAASDGQYCER